MPNALAPSRSCPLAPPWPAVSRVMVMGIVNVTPDSFSDGGQFDTLGAAIVHAERLAAEGADILDIGGESTRPGAAEVTADDEIARVVPVIRALAAKGTMPPISIDTYKAGTARAALAAGACIVNDVWGLMRDDAMADVVAEAGAGLVIMHNRSEKDEALDIVADMEEVFTKALTRAERAGIARARIALDPGYGFGKTLSQNLLAVRALPRLASHFGCAMLLGVSRKSSLALITGRDVGGRLAATLAMDAFGVLHGADILRVHDVAEHRDLVLVLEALNTAGMA